MLSRYIKEVVQEFSIGDLNKKNIDTWPQSETGQIQPSLGKKGLSS